MRPHRDIPWPAQTGMTLLELMAVMGVIAVLAGIGIGFLSRDVNDLALARAVFRDQVRLAHETAWRTGRPTSVEYFSEGQEGDALHWLRARVLSPVGQWHLEPDEDAFAALDPDLVAQPDPDGRFGYCIRPDLDRDGTTFTVPVENRARFGMDGGFALRLELYLERRAKCVVAVLGRTFRLELDDELAPSATLALAGQDPRLPGRTLDLEAPTYPLPLRRWVSLEILHDGRVFALRVGGVTVAEKPAPGEPFQKLDSDIFEVSPRGSWVPGKIDEIQLLAYEFGERAELPSAVEVKGLNAPILYDRHGRLVAPVTFELILGEEKERRTVAPGGVLK